MASEAPRTVKPKRERIKFEEAWPVIQGLLDRALRQALVEGREPTKFGGLSYADFMEVYDKVFNLTTSVYVSEVKPIYPALSKYFFEIADEMLAQVASGHVGNNDHAFLLSYLESYDHFLSAAMLLPHTFGMFERHWLKRYKDEWFYKPNDREEVPPPGMEWSNPSAPGGTGPSHGTTQVIGSMSGNAITTSRRERVLVPKPRAELEGEIMQWDSATAAGAPESQELAKLLWPPDGNPTTSRDGALGVIDGKEMAQCAARKYSSLPANVYMQLVPTLLRLWRLATVKHFGTDNDASMPSIVHKMQERGELREDVELVKRLAKCFWATGVLEQDMGFEELVAVLRSAC
ncbi:hypothetical protein CALVIDRAFT_596817 [Calocera viscosa TUFC12733]|uniref:Uncharacterized protein n=1 Tax=Calocera viscosa (strain TUFC12733) TaxID=1330018 RepID=A0A167NZU4_CALVF|nr:hypothetical protein CALVIDRAFT_596817 [Calocera viscosa TUFC12733]